MKVIKAADLFCGAGGTSEGLRRAALQMGSDLDLTAINHWPIAISSHQANHDYARHFCKNLQDVDPAMLVPGGKLDLLVASPECVHFSSARGGRPMCDQSRSSAREIIRWVDKIDVRRILIENVKEFLGWGPLDPDNRPIKARKGEFFLNFVGLLKRRGYEVEWRVLNAADYGDPTTRQRLFLMARNDGEPIIWPEPSHCDPRKLGRETLMKGGLEPWVAARTIIDWNLQGKSIFDRTKPLAPKTLQRIEAGLRKFGGKDAEPFLIILRRHMDAQSIDSPTPTLVGSGNHVGLVEPFLIGTGGPSGSGEPQSLADPIGTVLAENHKAVVEPFILPHRMFDKMDVDSVDKPLRTIVGQNGRGNKLCQPVLIKYHGGKDPEKWERSQALETPIQTVDTSNRFGLVEPVLVNMKGQSDASSIDSPAPTQTTNAHLYLAEPFIVPHQMFEEGEPDSIERPLRTIVGKKRHEREAVRARHRSVLR